MNMLDSETFQQMVYKFLKQKLAQPNGLIWSHNDKWNSDKGKQMESEEEVCVWSAVNELANVGASWAMHRGRVVQFNLAHALTTKRNRFAKRWSASLESATKWGGRHGLIDITRACVRVFISIFQLLTKIGSIISGQRYRSAGIRLISMPIVLFLICRANSQSQTVKRKLCQKGERERWQDTVSSLTAAY